jgi:uncharacterized membrane protein
VLDNVLLGVIGMNVFAVLLVLARGPVWHTRVYRPMLLNVGLSLAPMVVLFAGSAVAVALRLALSPAAGVVAAAVAFAAWLLVLPNASYLITELNLSHRREGEDVPMWFDIVLVITLAMSGVLNTVLNVFAVQFMYAVVRYGDTEAGLVRSDTRLLVAFVLLVVPVGMYLGRYVRLNSWDVRRPARVYRKIRDHLRRPGRVRELVGFSLLHAVFLALMYVVVIGTVLAALQRIEELP